MNSTLYRRSLSRIRSLAAYSIVSALVQAITLLLVARFTSPSVVGHYGFWLSVSAIGSIFLSARADQLVLAAPSRSGAVRLRNGALSISVTAGVLIVFMTIVASLCVDYSLVDFVIATLLTVAQIHFDLTRALMIRCGRVKVAGGSLIRRSIVGLVLLPAAAALSADGRELLAIQVVVILFAAPYKYVRYIRPGKQIGFLLEQRAQYSFGALGYGIGALSLMGAPIVFGMTLGSTVAGYIFLVGRLVQVPAGIIIRSLSEAINPLISTNDNRSTRSRVSRILLASALAVGVAGGLLILFARPIFASLLGAGWAAPEVSLALVLSFTLLPLLFEIYVSPQTLDFVRLSLQRKTFIWEVFRLLFVFGGVTTLAHMGASPNFVVVYWGCAASISLILLECYRVHVLWKGRRDDLKVMEDPV